MQIGQVVGTLVATQKHRKLEGAKLLLVQPLTLEGQAKGTPVLAIDSVGAGVGERVLYLIEGKAAQDALGRKAAPVAPAATGISRALATGAMAAFLVMPDRKGPGDNLEEIRLAPAEALLLKP